MTKSQNLFLLLLLTFFCFEMDAQNSTRKILELENNWKFHKGEVELAYQKDYSDIHWENVTVPHDWAIKGPFDKEIDKQTVAIVQNGEKIASEKTGRTGALPHIGVGWYRNQFLIPQFKEGKKVLLLFEGAMSEPEIFVNGQKVGSRNYGYSYFYFDITNYILPNKKQTLAVKLTNRELSSRWYPGAGLYRNVRVIVKNKESINQWGTFITTPLITSDLAKVNIKTKVSGEGLKMVTHILDTNGNRVAIDSAHTIFDNEFQQNIDVENPKLWSPETPYLYTAVTKLYKNNELKRALEFEVLNMNLIKDSV